MKKSLHVCALSCLHSEPTQRGPTRASRVTEDLLTPGTNLPFLQLYLHAWLTNTHSRGISAANSQWATGKCQDNLWFDSWLSTPIPDSCPDLAYGFSVFPMVCLWPSERQNEASLLCSSIACCPISYPILSCFVGNSVLANDVFGVVRDWTPRITHCTVWSPLLESLS